MQQIDIGKLELDRHTQLLDEHQEKLTLLASRIRDVEEGLRREFRKSVEDMQTMIVESLNDALRQHEKAEMEEIRRLIKLHEEAEKKQAADSALIAKDEKRFRIQNRWALISNVLMFLTILVMVWQGR